MITIPISSATSVVANRPVAKKDRVSFYDEIWNNALAEVVSPTLFIVQLERRGDHLPIKSMKVISSACQNSIDDRIDLPDACFFVIPDTINVSLEDTQPFYDETYALKGDQSDISMRVFGYEDSTKKLFIVVGTEEIEATSNDMRQVSTVVKECIVDQLNFKCYVVPHYIANQVIGEETAGR